MCDNVLSNGINILFDLTDSADYQQGNMNGIPYTYQNGMAFFQYPVHGTQPQVSNLYKSSNSFSISFRGTCLHCDIYYAIDTLIYKKKILERIR